jgi:hypothetical protein
MRETEEDQGFFCKKGGERLCWPVRWAVDLDQNRSGPSAPDRTAAHVRKHADGERRRWSGAPASLLGFDLRNTIWRAACTKVKRGPRRTQPRQGMSAHVAATAGNATGRAAVAAPTPASSNGRCGARARVEAAPWSFSPSCAALGVLPDGGTAAARETKGGGAS